MKRYQIVGGIAEVGPGQRLVLDASSYRRRAHRVTLIEEKDGGYVVEAKEVLQFKVGEIVGLPDLPKNMVEKVLPLDAPASETDKVAVKKAEQAAESAVKEKDKKRSPAKRGKSG